MNALKVTSLVKVREIDGVPVKVGEAKEIKVSSHKTHDCFVVLLGEEGSAITVFASDLEKAIRNATNA